MRIRPTVLCALAALAAAPLHAQEAPAPAATRMAAAEKAVAALLPPGTYARIMDGSMNAMLDQVLDSVSRMPLRDLAAAGGLDEERLADIGEGTMREMMEILDPAYDERIRLSTRAMVGEMKAMMSSFEPSLREGLAQAYAARFTAEQLDDINAFFATPSGALYARESMVLYTDPAVMAKMQEFMPRMMKQMPAMLEKVRQATADLPAARKYEDLDDEQKARFEALIGQPDRGTEASGQED
ncbi:hypothetical protein B2G71_08775 [Novosphingobium sp. PC22D]|uniref:DUF2059 domain-containing protein n=1 Tax=Novosphingobium sp. PC22D TaxID=1962403 RepID=UPI000BF24020|nr:DUF2059 domain-containing protein [Novosphingobium sp. PC22D]PEQ12921.1 hypothetical protein B2G71_08775 [Novosphingobium sp. PC22D]